MTIDGDDHEDVGLCRISRISETFFLFKLLFLLEIWGLERKDAVAPTTTMMMKKQQNKYEKKEK